MDIVTMVLVIALIFVTVFFIYYSLVLRHELEMRKKWWEQERELEARIEKFQKVLAETNKYIDETLKMVDEEWYKTNFRQWYICHLEKVKDEIEKLNDEI